MLCCTCLSLKGKKPLFPESKIYESRYWVVEHAYPVKIKGWLVVILKRHAVGLHELTLKEFSELAVIIGKLTKLIYQELGCQKEYISCFAEKTNFEHIHFHVIGRPDNLKKSEKGPRIFHFLKVTEAETIPKEEIIRFCHKIKKKMP